MEVVPRRYHDRIDGWVVDEFVVVRCAITKVKFVGSCAAVRPGRRTDADQFDPADLFDRREQHIGCETARSNQTDLESLVRYGYGADCSLGCDLNTLAEIGRASCRERQYVV